MPPPKPLAAELSRALRAIQAALEAAPGASLAGAEPKHPPRRLLVPDAFSNPGHVRFALKVTLAVMLCYAVQDLTDWPSIHTCVITCFFVSLATVGETVHKASLRITGCLIGAALGIGTILFAMPLMTDLGDLLLVLAAVTFLAGWIGNGGERIAYAGWQIGLAFYLSVLQGFGPTLDMETARDRLVGILIGNIAVFVIFTAIWPVGVGSVVRPALATAAEQLAGLMELQPQSGREADAAESGLRQAFGAVVTRAYAMLVNDPYEPRALCQAGGRRPIDLAIVLDVQALMVPVSVLAGLRNDPAWADVPEASHDMVLAHHRLVAQWFRRCAAWVRSGIGAAEIAESWPEQPGAALLATAEPASRSVSDHLAARATWYGLLQRGVRAILDQVAPDPQPRTAPSSGRSAGATR